LTYSFYAGSPSSGTLIDSVTTSVGNESLSEGPLLFGNFVRFYFQVRYSGDSNYLGADSAPAFVDNFNAIGAFSFPNPTSGTVGRTTLNDTAELFFGFNPSGTIT